MKQKASVKLQFIVGFLYSHLAVSQDCTLPQELWGTWTSTNLGTMEITGASPSLTFSKVFVGQVVTENRLDCRFTSGTQYILRSQQEIPTFSTTEPVVMWMCLDLRRTSAYSYYYYLNSPQELGFDNYRLVGLPNTTTTASDVCTESPDVAEFHTMIKDGNETDAVNAVDCADPLLGSFRYTYTDSSGTYCENANTSTINSCNSNGTHIMADNSDCTSVNPFYSTGGVLGCIANVYNPSSGVYYTALYNLDTSPTTQFVCTAVIKSSDGTVFLSTRQTECVAGQSPTTLPAGGATMVLTANCLLDNTESQKRNWTWLIIFVPCLVLLIIFIVVCVLLYFWLKKRERRRARTKKALENSNHPLGEVSIKLDAPASLGLHNDFVDRNPERRRKSEDGEDLFGEQSLDLNLETKTWIELERGKRPPVTNKVFSAAAVNGSNGTIPNGSVRKSKASGSIGGRFKSRTKNFWNARMAANTLRGGTKINYPKSYERSTKASNGRGPSLKTNNGIHPEPSQKTRSVTGSNNGILPEPRKKIRSKAGSRPGSRAESRAFSRAGSRRGSIDNLVISRSNRVSRSKTMVLAQPKEDMKPNIYPMPEEFVTDGCPNELMPVRPIPVTSNNLRHTNQSLNRRSFSQLALKKPEASKNPWH